MSIFNYYPKIDYNNVSSINILSEAEVVRKYVTDLTKFFKYEIKEGERPDIIAYKQYEDPSLEWVIFLVNGIVDPYKDWPMDSKQFISYLEDKYNTAAEKLTSTAIASSIAYYYYKGLASDTDAVINSYNYTLSAYSYQKLGSPSGWQPKSIWDYENEINESKREIMLLRPIYISDFRQQIRDIFNNG